MKELFISIGLPGCGKTTYLKNETAFKPSTFISSDWVRQEVTGNMSDLSQDKTKVWPLVFERLKKALRSKAKEAQTIVFDTTALSVSARKKVMDILNEWGEQATLRVRDFAADVTTCIDRQKNRARKVPVPAMFSLSKARQPFTPSEAPANITVDHQIIPTVYTLPNEARPVIIKGVNTLKALEKRLATLGFWKEGAEWCSGRAATLVFDAKRSKKDLALEEAIAQLVEKGFARIEGSPKATTPQFGHVA